MESKTDKPKPEDDKDSLKTLAMPDKKSRRDIRRLCVCPK